MSFRKSRCCFTRVANRHFLQVMLVVMNLPDSAGDIRDESSITGSGRSPGEGHSNPLQYSCLENPMHRGAWQATVHGFAKSWTWLKWLIVHTLCDSYCTLSCYWNDCLHSQTNETGTIVRIVLWFNTRVSCCLKFSSAFFTVHFF